MDANKISDEEVPRPLACLSAPFSLSTECWTAGRMERVGVDSTGSGIGRFHALAGLARSASATREPLHEEAGDGAAAAKLLES